MASPAVAEVVEGGLTSAGANLAVTLPAGGSGSDEYIVIIAKGSVSNSINALTDWTELLDEAVAAGLAIIRYTGTGVPSNPTFVQSANSRSVWCAYRITGADKSIAPEVGTTAVATSNVPNPPSRSVTGGPKDILAIACFSAAGEIADDNTLVTTFPTDYTLGQVEKAAGTAGTNLAGMLGAAARQVAAATTEDPGTFLQNASRAWRAQTIVIHPVGPKSTSVARVSLAAGSTPVTRTAHAIKVRARVTGGAGTLNAALYEGATNRSGDLETSELTATLAEYSLAISNANAANITSYADLEIRFWGYSATGEAITVEIDQIWLETSPVPAGGTTYYGASAMAVTFGKEVIGRRKTFGQTATLITFSKDVNGRRKTFGQTAFPINVTIATAGFRPGITRYGATAFPITFSKDVNGRRKTFGQTAFPINVTIATAGFRPGITRYGALTLPITFSKDVNGRRKTFGQLLSPFIFGKAVAGRKSTFGQTAFPINITIATAGFRSGIKQYGALALPVIFGKEVTGRRKVYGQIALPLTFVRDTAGRRKTFGQIAFPIIFTKEALGRKTAFGLLSMQTLFGKETAGRRKTFGQIALPLIFTKQVYATKKTFGQVAFPIEFWTFVDGALASNTRYGSTSLSVTFDKYVSGNRKTFGQVTAPFNLGAFVQGQRNTFSIIDIPIDLLIDVESGLVSTHGQISLPILVEFDTNGTIRSVATILNMAEMIYLGTTPVLAVYTENQKVWPL